MIEVLFLYSFLSIHYFIFIQFHHTTLMGYNRFVQIGRVARVIFGPEQGKIATIVDILNDKRVLIDGENIARQVIPIRRLQLTKQIAGVKRGAKSSKVKAIFKKEKVAKNYADSSIGRSYDRQARRQNLTDFERFKVLVLRRKLSKLTRAKADKKNKKK